MKVAALQLDIVWEDRKANYARVREYAENAAGQGVDLLVLPEMFSTGFSMNPAVTAEPEEGPTAAFLKQLARDFHLAVVGGLVLEGTGGKGRNSALVVDKTGEALATYTKTHLFSFMDEDKHHEPGNGPVLFELGGMRWACFICYDLRFPELFRLFADKCDGVMVIASWPAARQTHWDLLLPARAVENQHYIIGVNRVGAGGGLDYTGGSAIIDPLGGVLACGRSAESLLVADISANKVTAVRKSMPFLNDRKL